MTGSTPALADTLHRRRLDRRARAADRARGAEPVEKLSALLIGTERNRLEQLEERLTPEALGRMLPGATVAAREQGDEHAKALAPTIVAALHETIQREPGPFVDAIAPAMGAAIRTAVTNALRALVQQLNETLARALSVQGLIWRLEAIRTGRPFAEVVLLRSLVFRTEQMFLIHRDSGLVLRHVVAPGTPNQDPNQVAAMVTAINAFVADAFSGEAPLGRFYAGDLTCWVEHGPSLLLVAAVRGTAPDSYADVLRDALERIRGACSEELSAFRGDVAPFEAAVPIMLDCQRAELEAAQPPKRCPPYATVLAVLLAVVIAAFVGLRVRGVHADARTLDSGIAALDHHPGIVVVSARIDDGMFRFEGLADPLEETPDAILERAGLPPARTQIRFAPFQSLDAHLAQRRAAIALRPPPTVAIALSSDGTLALHGAAGRAWIERARAVGPTLPGVSVLDLGGLVDAGASEDIARRREALSALYVFFAVGSDEIAADQQLVLDTMAAHMSAIVAEAEAAAVSVTFDVIGFADRSGERADNEALSRRRASRVASELRARDVPASALRSIGAGVLETDDTCAKGGSPNGEACARRVGVRPDIRAVDRSP